MNAFGPKSIPSFPFYIVKLFCILILWHICKIKQVECEKFVRAFNPYKKAKACPSFLCAMTVRPSRTKRVFFYGQAVVEAKNTELCNKRSYPIKYIDSALTLKWIGQPTPTELTEMFRKCPRFFLDKSLRTNLSIATHDFCRSIFCWTAPAT